MSDSTPTPDLEVTPFPRLRWADYGWEGTAILTAWAGFQSRLGAYGSRDTGNVSDGRAGLNVASPHANNRAKPSAAQRAAYELLLSEQARVRHAMLTALSSEYKAWRSAWAKAMDAGELEEVMPPVSDIAGFRRLVGLSNIHLLDVEKDGRAYIGFELGCTWDDEHGLGFMTHGDRIVEVGGADTSFLEWIAERDANARAGPAEG